jgi:signal transduction histidine kinase/CheY-like chemotaxis protein
VLTIALVRKLVLFAALPSCLLAQRYSFKLYGQEAGLTNLDVHCLMQDRTGFLWVATEGGLFRYDGRQFVPYTPEQGLPSAQVYALHQTADGVIWAGTAGGLARLAGDRFEKAPVPASLVGAIASDSRGVLYVGSEAGLWTAPPSAMPSQRDFHINIVPGQGQQRAYGVAVERSGRVWFGCGTSLCTLEDGRVSVHRDLGMPATPWFGLLVDTAGNLWARGMQSLMELPAGASKAIARDAGLPMAPRNPVVLLDSYGDIVAPTSQGLALRKGDGWTLIRRTHGLPISATDYFLQDREGSAWIALDGGGLVRWVGYKQWETWTESEGLTNDVVWGIARDSKGALWVATQAGVSSLAPKSVRWEALADPTLDRAPLTAMTADTDGTLWLAQTPGELIHLNPVNRRVEHYGRASGLETEWIVGVALDSSRGLWVGTMLGLYHADRGPGGLLFKKVALPFDRLLSVRGIFEDSRKRLWVATGAGLAYLENGRWKRVTTRDGLRQDIVAHVAEAPDHAIWVAYRDPIGLGRITFDGNAISVAHYGVHEGVPESKPYFLRFDRRGWLWLGTESGVVRYDGRTWAQYERSDGLALSDCDQNAFFDDLDGSVWIGTPRGLSHFLSPASARLRPREAPAMLTSLSLGAAPAPLSGGITVPYRRRSLDVGFAALTFVNEESVRFRHRVLGLDDTWTETRQAEAHYPGLPPGRYRFQVQASAAPGQWPGAAAEVSFVVQAPWWRQWWALLSEALLAGLLFREVWRWRVLAILRRQQELERAVADRTGKLAAEHERAVEQKARAEREKETVEKQKVAIEELLWESRQAERAKNEFLANVSHEVRTPLNGIMGITDLVLQSGVTADQAENLRIIKLSSDSLLSLLTGVLDFSKMDAGKFALESSEFDPRNIVEDVVRTMSGLAQTKQVELRTRIAPSLPARLTGDPARLRQVLVNLIGNAIKFTESGHVEIEVQPQMLEPKQAVLHFQVRDTGIGISPEQQALIFEPFRQGDGSNSRRYGGAGLGLAICARLISLMGGRIWVDSSPGAGSAFQFTARFGRVDAAPHAPRTEPAASASTAVPGGGLKILLVEDNAVNQKLARRLLENAGHTVTCAGDGRQALDAWEAAPFDLVLMDIQMPVMDGLEATAELRRREELSGRHTPILAVTANAMQGDRERCLEAGMDGYVAKPIKREELFKAIAALVALAW